MSNRRQPASAQQLAWLRLAFVAMVLAAPILVAAEVVLPAVRSQAGVQNFLAKGVIKELKADGTSVVIKHEAIPGLMDAMTMPFRVLNAKELAGLQAGEEVTFQLHVTDTESWIDHVSKTGTTSGTENKPVVKQARESQPAQPRHPLLDYQFTNELGQAVSLGSFRGQALAITFFFTRCPIPDYCPRLSKNFQAASQQLAKLPNAPTNWHFLSVSFDTEFDTPAVLKAYAERYDYDPKHWSFLTGPKEKITELAALSDVKFDREAGFYNHNFRTLIIDATGRLQMTFPVVGNLMDPIVQEVLRAAVATAQ